MRKIFELWVKCEKKWLLEIIFLAIFCFLTFLLFSQTEWVLQIIPRGIFSEVFFVQEKKFIFDVDKIITVSTGMSAIIIALYVAILQAPKNFLDERAALLKSSRIHISTFVILLIFLFGFSQVLPMVTVGFIFFVIFYAIFQVFFISQYYSSVLLRNLVYNDLLKQMTKSFIHYLKNAESTREDGLEDTIFSDFMGEIRQIKITLFEAIKNENGATVELALEILRDFLEIFIEQMGKLELYDEEEEKYNEKYRQFLSDLYHFIENILETGLKNDSKSIIRQISIFTSFLMSICIQANKFDLFKEYTDLPSVLYEASLGQKNDALASSILDSSKWTLFSLFKNLIENKADIVADLKNEKNPIIQILISFQLLLQKAFEKKDLKNFISFMKTLKGLTEEDNLISDPQKIKPEIKKEVDKMLFALAAWISKDRNEESFLFYESILEYLPQKIEDLYEIYLFTRNLEKENFYRGEYMFEGTEAFFEKLDWFYIIRLISSFDIQDSKGIPNLWRFSHKLKDVLPEITAKLKEVPKSPFYKDISDADIEYFKKFFLP